MFRIDYHSSPLLGPGPAHTGFFSKPGAHVRWRHFVNFLMLATFFVAASQMPAPLRWVAISWLLTCGMVCNFTPAQSAQENKHQTDSFFNRRTAWGHPKPREFIAKQLLLHSIWADKWSVMFDPGLRSLSGETQIGVVLRYYVSSFRTNSDKRRKIAGKGSGETINLRAIKIMEGGNVTSPRGTGRYGR